MQFHRSFIALLGFTLFTACDAEQASSCVEVWPGAERSSGEAPPPSISVTGFGTVSATPDTATFQIGTQTRGADASAAMAESNAKVVRITTALTGLGVAAGDIQVTNVAMSGPGRAGPGGAMCQTDDQCAMDEICDNGNCVFSGVAGQPGHPVAVAVAVAGSVVVDQQLMVTLRDPGMLAEALAQVAAAGSDSIQSVAFGIGDPGALNRQARELAVADARARAEQLAAGLGATLGAPMTIAEAQMGFDPYTPLSSLAPARLADQVTVTYRLQ